MESGTIVGACSLWKLYQVVVMATRTKINNFSSSIDTKFSDIH